MVLATGKTNKQTNRAIHWIVISPADKVIHPSNNWGQSAIYKHGQGVELGSTEKQLHQLAVRMELEPAASQPHCFLPSPST